MHTAYRSYLTAGVAALGAGAVALSPVQPIPTHVALTQERAISNLAVELAATVDPTAKSAPIPPEAVDDFAGTPQERTAWGMVDAAATGDAATAVKQLADLLEAGENPVGIAAQIASVLRRLATAARLLALQRSGVHRQGFVDNIGLYVAALFNRL
jgi:hypothetical protein